MPTIRLVSPQGEILDVDVDAAGAAIEQGWRTPTAAESTNRVAAEAAEAEYGGVGGAAVATLAGGLRGVSVGASDVAARVLGDEQLVTDLRGYREQNPGYSIGSEFVGAIAPALLTGGASTPASAASIAGRGVARAVGGGLRGAIAGGATEGAIGGFGAGLSELALSRDDLTLERAASALSSNVLFGAAAGGAGGAAANAAERGLLRAQRVIDARLAREVAGDLPDDLSTLDAKGLQAARQAEIESLDRAAVPERQRFVDDLTAYRKSERDLNLNNATKGADDRDIREAGSKLFDADMAVRRVTDDPIGLARKPERAITPLERQQHALEEALKGKAAAEEAWAQMPAKIRQEILDGKNPDFVVPAKSGKWKNPGRGAESGFTEAGLDNAVAKTMEKRFGKPTLPMTADRVTDDIIKEVREHAIATGNTGLATAARVAAGQPVSEMAAAAIGRGRGMVAAAFDELHPPGFPRPANLQALDAIPEMLEQNRVMQERVRKLIAEPTSERLAKIDEALERLKAPKEASVAEQLSSAISAVPGVPDIGAAGRALGRLRKLADKAARKGAESASKVLAASARGARAAAPYAPLTATKILGGVSFASALADRDEQKRGEIEGAKQSQLARLFRARTDEIKALTAYNDAGVPELRPEARANLARLFDGIRPDDPIGADRLETVAARRIEYLSSVIPRRPDMGGVPMGPDRWAPSDMQMRSFARSVAAVENPMGVLERVADGIISPEDGEVMRRVYPEILAAFAQEVTAGLPKLTRSLPYRTRLAIAILTDVPVDPAMSPVILNRLQAMYASEPGTEGGTQAPKAQPQFGSVRAPDDSTPTQRRQKGSGP